jgi:hypothetical protein
MYVYARTVRILYFCKKYVLIVFRSDTSRIESVHHGTEGTDADDNDQAGC